MAKERGDFTACTIRFTGRANRIITDVAVSDAYDPANPPATVPSPYSTKALWDTGATGSVISMDVANRLKLTPTGEVEVNHAGGKGKFHTYVVNLYLPNKVGVVGVQVSACPTQPGFEVIIGMDVICHGDFSITNRNGETMMSYRTPSIKAIDYVQEATRLKFAGVGRNDPCPCGSGNKFKKCCWTP